MVKMLGDATMDNPQPSFHLNSTDENAVQRLNGDG
jgi:hypothetical protein